LTFPIPPTLIELQHLRLDDARALLEHAGQDSHPQPGEAPLQYLQRLIDGLSELSLKDPLTGLGNRRYLHAALERAIETVARSGDAVLLLLIDIDHFKHINDAHGHLAGDQVLQAVANRLALCVRPMDMVARYGGEEFALLLPNCRPTCGRTVADRVRAAIESLMIEVTPNTQLQVTVSIGGAYAPEWVRSTTELWTERADLQLYRAKHNGRNQVMLELPQQISVSAEEKGLLFSHLPLPGSEAAGQQPDAAPENAGTPIPRVIA